MRILGLETSSVRGSVALVEGEASVCALEHRRENAHGESILPLVERALAEAGWSRQQLDRIAVGIGPGSFTGLRVGIALAQGLAEGLGLPLVGVPSLQLVALAVPPERRGPRCVLMDARKGECFAAVYDAQGVELAPVRLVAGADDVQQLTRDLVDPVYVGNAVVLSELGDAYRSPDTELPHARYAALAARNAQPSVHVQPLYVRDAGAVIPRLPDNPLRAGARPARG